MFISTGRPTNLVGTALCIRPLRPAIVGGASNAVRFSSKKSHLPRCVRRRFGAKRRVAAETVDFCEKNYQTSVTSIGYYRFYEQVCCPRG